MQNILGNIRKAIQDFSMINEGDKIAIGLSGGKDSLALLYSLANLRKFYEKHFELMAITIDAGFDGFDTTNLMKICEELDVEYIVYKSDIKEIVFDIRKEKNPCSLCANLRRGMLNSVAKENGCNKVALGHHQDDVIETLLMSLFYEGHIHTFSPVTYLSRKDITIIRPMIYLTENEIKKWIKDMNLITMKKCCEADGFTTREEIKNFIQDYTKKIPYFKSNLFGAVKRSNINGWNTNEKEEINEE